MPPDSKPEAQEFGQAEDRVKELVQGYLEPFPWADVLALEANLAVMETADALRKAIARFIAPLDLSLGPPRYLVVRAIFLAQGGRLSLSEVARRTGATTTNVTNLVDGLERDGWVARQTNPRDRRVTYVTLTPEGHERCGRLLPAVARYTSDLLSVLSRQEQSELIGTLAKLRRRAEEWQSAEAGETS